MHKYLISGIFVESDRVLGDFVSEVDDVGFVPDVSIRTMVLPVVLPPQEATTGGVVNFHAMPGLVFLISCRDISIIQDNSISDVDVNIYLFGSAWGILCHQRDLFPLHCSAVGVGRRAVAFVAQSGHGKSTLAASLCNKGFLHACDDVAIAEVSDGPNVNLRATPKGLKLWADAVNALSLKPLARVTSDAKVEKFYVSPPDEVTYSSLELAAIYSLEYHTECQPLKIELLVGAEALKVIFRNVYRVEWLGEIGGAEQLLRQANAIAKRIPVYRFSRTRDIQLLAKSTTELAAHIRTSIEERPLANSS